MLSSMKGGYGPTCTSEHLKMGVSLYTNPMFHKDDTEISFTYKITCTEFF